MRLQISGWRGWLRLIFNLAVLGFLAWAAITFPWQETLDALRGTRPWFLVIAAMAHLISFVAKGWAWQLLLHPVSPCRWWVCQEANMVGTAINNVSIMLVGEGTRAKIVQDRDGIPLGLGISSILWARVLEAVSYAFFLGIAPFFLDLPSYYRPAQIAALASLGGLGLIDLTRRWVPDHLPRLGGWWARMRERIGQWGWVRWLSERSPESLKRSLRALIEIPLVTSKLPWILLLSAINWTLEWISVDLSFRAVGVPISAGASFSVLTLTNAAWLVRITPGNVGIVQGASVLALLPFGITPSIAVAGGLVLQAVQALPPLAVAGILVLIARFWGRRGDQDTGRGDQGTEEGDQDTGEGGDH